MEHPGFFERAPALSLHELAQRADIVTFDAPDPSLLIEDIRPLDTAGPAHATFLDNRKYLPMLAQTKAAACFVHPGLADRVPSSVVRLITPTPYRAFAQTLFWFYPTSARPRTTDTRSGQSAIHPDARIEDGAIIEYGAVIGAQAHIGGGTLVAAGAVIGYRVRVGRDGYIGPGATLTHALVGDRVTIHAGVRIGQDGFGFAMGPAGHLKVPQIGRVLIHDDVEIGANSTIDRGALKDTIIGEGTKIDNLVQIGHNVVMGRHCVIVAHTGIAGSVELGDFVVMGGQSGASGHIKIGSGAHIAGRSAVTESVPPGARWGGAPAKPFREWARELAAVKKLGVRNKS